MAAYKLQKGQIGKVEDILKMLDDMDLEIHSKQGMDKLVLTLGILGLTTAAALKILKGRGLVK